LFSKFDHEVFPTEEILLKLLLICWFSHCRPIRSAKFTRC